MRRSGWLSVVLLCSASGAARAEDFALVGGTILPGDGPGIEAGTVIIRNERILAVGQDLAIPSGATVISCGGRVVTPGLVDPATHLGLVEISEVKETEDASAVRRDPIRAALSMADGINLRSALVDAARRQGVTSVVATPSDGLISGQSAWVDLLPASSSLASSSILSPIAVHAAMGEAGAAALGGSRPQALLRLKEALEDARIFAADRRSFERNALRKLVTSRLDLAALVPIVESRRPLVVDVHRADDIERVLAFAAKERIKVILHGAEEAWLVAPAIKAAGVPVILNPMVNLPVRFEAREARADNAALLVRAGVRVAVTTDSSHGAGNLRFHLGNAVRAGLPKDQALTLATLRPAELFGLEKSHGSLRPGKLANLVVWTGDPLEPASWAEEVFIRGERQSLESRRSKLRARHQARLGLAQP